jgi:hypothetical protein
LSFERAIIGDTAAIDGAVVLIFSFTCLAGIDAIAFEGNALGSISILTAYFCLLTKDFSGNVRIRIPAIGSLVGTIHAVLARAWSVRMFAGAFHWFTNGYFFAFGLVDYICVGAVEVINILCAIYTYLCGFAEFSCHIRENLQTIGTCFAIFPISSIAGIGTPTIILSYSIGSSREALGCRVLFLIAADISRGTMTSWSFHGYGET